MDRLPDKLFRNFPKFNLLPNLPLNTEIVVVYYDLCAFESGMKKNTMEMIKIAQI